MVRVLKLYVRKVLIETIVTRTVQAFVPLENPRLARWSMMPLYGYFPEPINTRLDIMSVLEKIVILGHTVRGCEGIQSH